MKRFGLLLAGVAVGLFATACERDDQAMLEKLEKIENKIDLLAKSGRGGAGAGRQKAKPRGPDPAAVYSVDVAGNAYEGSAEAKVTVVEAFEFA